MTVAKFEPAFTRCRFQNVPVRVSFSKSTVFKMCRQRNVPFCCEREAYPSHFFTVFIMCPHCVNAVLDSTVFAKVLEFKCHPK